LTRFFGPVQANGHDPQFILQNRDFDNVGQLAGRLTDLPVEVQGALVSRLGFFTLPEVVPDVADAPIGQGDFLPVLGIVFPGFRQLVVEREQIFQHGRGALGQDGLDFGVIV